MNGLCGTTAAGVTSATLQDRCTTGSPNRRGVNIGGGSQPPGQDQMRKSRSQGGKKLQKCLSTASYGEELSISRPQMMTPLSHNLLMTRQYASFGSTTRPSLFMIILIFSCFINYFC